MDNKGRLRVSHEAENRGSFPYVKIDVHKVLQIARKFVDPPTCVPLWPKEVSSHVVIYSEDDVELWSQ